jgi:hypothetical protein
VCSYIAIQEPFLFQAFKLYPTKGPELFSHMNEKRRKEKKRKEKKRKEKGK